MKPPNFIWVLGFWTVMSALIRPGWLAFSSGFILCLVLMYIKTPGEFWHFLGLLSFRQSTLERYLARSVACKPAIPQPYLKLGLLHYQRQEWSRAIPLLEEAIVRRGGKCPSSLGVILAAAYRENHQECLAIPLLQGMVDHGSRTADVFYHLALCFLGLHDTQAALDALREAHALNPDAVRPVMIMGSIHFMMNDFATAKQDYQWLVSTLPKPAESLYWLGRAELELGEIQSAAEHLQLAVSRIAEHQDISTISLEEVRHWLKTANDLRHRTLASPMD